MSRVRPTTGKRLIYIKQLLNEAQGRAADTADLNRMLLVIHLDFAIEMLLKGIVMDFGEPDEFPGRQADYYTKKRDLSGYSVGRDPNFPMIWDWVTAICRTKQEIPWDRLPYRREIHLLHSARNSAQHQVLVPSQADINRHLDFAERFIVEVVAQIYAMNLNEVTLASLLTDEELRAKFEEAEESYKNGEYGLAIVHAAQAFQQGLIYQQSTRLVDSRSSREFKYELRQLSGEYSRNTFEQLFDRHLGRAIKSDKASGQWAMQDLGRNFDRLFRDLLSVISRTVLGLDARISLLAGTTELLAAGLDLQQYTRYRQLISQLQLDSTGHYQLPQDWKPDKGQAAEVMSFTFNSLLRWFG